MVEEDVGDVGEVRVSVESANWVYEALEKASDPGRRDRPSSASSCSSTDVDPYSLAAASAECEMGDEQVVM